jgi:hypothetical protein
MGFIQVVYRGRSGLTDKHFWCFSLIAYTAGPHFSFVIIIGRKFSKEMTMREIQLCRPRGFLLLHCPSRMNRRVSYLFLYKYSTPKWSGEAAATASAICFPTSPFSAPKRFGAVESTCGLTCLSLSPEAPLALRRTTLVMAE